MPVAVAADYVENVFGELLEAGVKLFWGIMKK